MEPQSTWPGPDGESLWIFSVALMVREQGSFSGSIIESAPVAQMIPLGKMKIGKAHMARLRTSSTHSKLQCHSLPEFDAQWLWTPSL